MGAMFNDFVAHPLQRYSLGVCYIDTNLRLTVEPEELLRFSVLNFGKKTSPYLACQGQTHILEMAMKPLSCEDRTFQWYCVHLNLPASLTCDPS